MPFLSGKLFKGNSPQKKKKKNGLEGRALLLEKASVSNDEQDTIESPFHTPWKNVPDLSNSSSSDSTGGESKVTTSKKKDEVEDVQRNASLFDDMNNPTDDEEEDDDDVYPSSSSRVLFKNDGPKEMNSNNSNHNGKTVNGLASSLCDSLCNAGVSAPEHLATCRDQFQQWQESTSCYNNDNANSFFFSDKIIQQSRLFQDFTYLLGSPSTPTTDEKSIFHPSDILTCITHTNSHQELKTQLPNLQPQQHLQQKQQQQDNKHSTRIRNRAGESWRSRAYRVKRLREEIMMKVKDCRNTNTSMNKREQKESPHIILSKSMDDTATGGYNYQHDSTHKTPPKHNNKKLITLPSVVESNFLLDCGDLDDDDDSRNDKQDAPKDKITLIQQEDLGLCYDSDPGEYYSTSTTTLKQRKKKNTTQHKHGATSTKNKQNNDNLRIISSQDEDDDDNTLGTDIFDGLNSDDDETIADSSSNNESLVKNNNHDINDDRYPQVSDLEKYDNMAIQQAVQETLNQTFHLTWHPTSELLSQRGKNISSRSNNDDDDGNTLLICCNEDDDSSDNNQKNGYPKRNNLSPRCVEVWFERGSRIGHDDIIEPKIMWRDSYHPELESRRKLNLSSTEHPYQVSLLNICRLLGVSSQKQMDRKRYPLAKSSCSFQLKTCNNDEVLFEAKNEKERDQIVHFWKLVVARLASQAVVGDGDAMVDEYFVPSSYCVQGRLVPPLLTNA